MSSNVRSVLLKLTGDGDDAKRTLREVAGELVKLGHEKAVAEIRVNADKARLELTTFRKELDGLDSSAKIDLQIVGAEAKLDALRARLERLRSLDSSPRVDIAIGNALAQIDRVEVKIAGLGARKVEPSVNVSARDALVKLAELDAALKIIGSRSETATVKVKIDAKREDLARVRSEIEHTLAGGIAAKPLEGLFGDVERLGGEFEKLASQTGGFFGGLTNASEQAGAAATKLGTSLASSVVGGLGTVLGLVGALLAALVLLGPTIVGVVTALFALVAALAAAAAGAGVLGIALLAAFGPVAAVVAVVVAHITNIVAAQKKQAAAAATLKNALVSQKQAQDALATAEANQSAQRLAALAAERDAVNGLKDAQNALSDAKLGVESSKIQLARARQDLAAFKAEATATQTSLFAKFKDVDVGKLSGKLDAAGVSKSNQDALLTFREKLQAVRLAAQGVKDSVQGVADATASEGKAQQTSDDFRTKGLLAFAPYTAALKQTATAQNSLEKATTTAIEAQRKQADILGQLSPAGSRFAAALTAIKKEISTAFGPAENAVFSGLTAGLEDIDKLLKNKAVRDGLHEVGLAIDEVIRALGTEVSSRSFESSFATFAKGGAELTRIFGGKVLPNLLRFLLDIAKEALPELLHGARGLGDAFDGFVTAEEKGGKLHRQIRAVLSALRSVGRFASALVGVLADLFGPASKSGQHLIDKMTALLDKLDRIIEKASKDGSLQAFFAHALDKVRELYDLIKGVVNLLISADKLLHGDAKTSAKVDPALGAGEGAGGFIDKLLHIDPKNGLLGKPLKGLLKTLGLPFGADGGIATGLTVAGDAGHEALIPLRADVLARLGAAISAHMPTLGLGSPSAPRSPTAAATGGPRHTHLHIKAPAGEWPDMGHAFAVIDQRLDAIGA